MKSLLKKIIPSKFIQHHFVRYLRLWLNFRFVIKKRLRSQLQFKKSLTIPTDLLGKRILIPIIETAHYQHFQLLAIAKALELRGAEVRILICGQFLDACEIKSVKKEQDKDPCLECRFNEKNILPMFGLNVLKLSDIITSDEKSELKEKANHYLTTNSAPIIQHGINLNQLIDDSIVRYYYGSVPKDETVVSETKKKHINTALISSRVAYKTDKEWSPDVVFSHMYSYTIWGPIYEYYNANGNRFNSVSINNFNYNALLINTPKLFESTERYGKYLSLRNNGKLNEKESAILNSFIKGRVAGTNKFFVNYNYFNESRTHKELSKLLNIDKRKRNLFLFSNIFWDIGISSYSKLFEGVIDWILQTIEIVSGDQDKVHLYIRPHPGERANSLSSQKGISDFINENISELPPNITIIDPLLKVKSYDLFPFIDLGVMFNGTLGLEMILSDISVVSTGKIPYEGLGLSMEPKTIKNYREILLGNYTPPVVDRNQLEIFAYFYFIKTMVPFGIIKRCYGDIFDGFTINSLNDLMPGQDKYLDHLCNCILDPSKYSPENW